MWEEGAHIYGTPGVPNNFPLTKPARLEVWAKFPYLTPEVFSLQYDSFIAISISVFPWFMFHAMTKNYGWYFIQYGKSLQSAQNIMNMN